MEVQLFRPCMFVEFLLQFLSNFPISMARYMIRNFVPCRSHPRTELAATNPSFPARWRVLVFCLYPSYPVSSEQLQLRLLFLTWLAVLKRRGLGLSSTPCRSVSLARYRSHHPCASSFIFILRRDSFSFSLRYHSCRSGYAVLAPRARLAT